MTVSRMEFAQSLKVALRAAEPEQEVRQLLRSVLVTEPAPWHSDEEFLVRHIAERLDAASSFGDQFLAISRDVLDLLETASSPASVESLLGVFAERDRFLGILGKHADGTISRTSFSSYVAEQSWPRELRHRITALSDDGLASLRSALESKDVRRLERLLTLET